MSITKLINFSLLVLAVYLTACQPQSRHRDQSVDKSAIGEPRAAQGTVDGGGGAGFNGLPLEEYKRNITKLPEFINVVQPVIDSVNKFDPEFGKMFNHIVQNRMWLFMNAPIPKIPSSRQGTPFNIDQWAVQDSLQIWMSDEYKGEESHRGMILLHEIFVGLKILRFLSYAEYCRIITTDVRLCDRLMNKPMIKNYKLNDLDHADVRAMTAWLLENYRNTTAKEFGEKMHLYQFQGPHYGWKPLIDQGPESSRVLNPLLSSLVGKKINLFSSYGQDRLAQNSCEVLFGEMKDSHWLIKVRYRNLKTLKVIHEAQFNMKFNPAVEVRVSQVMNNYERYYTLTLTEGKEQQLEGDQQQYLSLDFDDNELIHVFGATSELRKNNKGEFSSFAAQGSDGVSCLVSPVEIPLQYGLWREMRPYDREAAEKNYYGGKTLEQLLIQTASWISRN